MRVRFLSAAAGVVAAAALLAAAEEPKTPARTEMKVRPTDDFEVTGDGRAGCARQHQPEHRQRRVERDYDADHRHQRRGHVR